MSATVAALLVTMVTHGAEDGVEDGVAVVAGGGALHHVATVGVAQGPLQDLEAHLVVNYIHRL